MKRTLVLATLFLFSFSSLAIEKVTIQVQGMHCGSCVKSLNRKVCQELALENCEVNLTNRKEEMGQISFSKKEGLDLIKVKSIITDAGYKPLE